MFLLLPMLIASLLLSFYSRNKNAIILGYSLFAVSLIFINGIVRCRYNGGNDILMTKLGVADLDGWSITHFLFFYFLGTVQPDMFWQAMLLGALWEGVEQFFGQKRPSWMGGFGDCDLTSDQLDSSHKNWWFGRYSDLIMNALGFMVARYVGGMNGLPQLPTLPKLSGLLAGLI